MKPRIAVIGASIVGNGISTLLHRLGYDVTVFEKHNKGTLHSHGAGICLPTPLIEQLIEEGLSDDSLQTNLIKRREFIITGSQGEGKILADYEYAASSMYWDSLYQALAAKQLENNIQYGKTV